MTKASVSSRAIAMGRTGSGPWGQNESPLRKQRGILQERQSIVESDSLMDLEIHYDQIAAGKDAKTR